MNLYTSSHDRALIKRALDSYRAELQDDAEDDPTVDRIPDLARIGQIIDRIDAMGQ